MFQHKTARGELLHIPHANICSWFKKNLFRTYASGYEVDVAKFVLLFPLSINRSYKSHSFDQLCSAGLDFAITKDIRAYQFFRSICFFAINITLVMTKRQMVVRAPNHKIVFLGQHILKHVTR